MKSVLISIQPYYVFLIIARLMGWHIPQEKTIEVRKNFPKAPAWDKHVHIYCSKNRKLFNRIPKQYQPLMEKLLGKVIGSFVCDSISILPTIFITKNVYGASENAQRFASESCLTQQELIAYCGTNDFLYGWRIFNLIIYDKPKELKDIATRCTVKSCIGCEHYDLGDYYNPPECRVEGFKPITRPPQSWCYIEE